MTNNVNFKDYEKGKINLISITEELVSGLTKLNATAKRCLVLVDSNLSQEFFAGKKILKCDSTLPSLEDHLIIMTYDAFGSFIKRREIETKNFHYLVCTELHSALSQVLDAREKLQEQFPQATPWEINDMLEMTCYSYVAIKTIKDWTEKQGKLVFASSNDAVTQLDNLIKEINFSQQVRAYHNFNYAIIDKIIQNQASNKLKRVLTKFARETEDAWDSQLEEFCLYNNTTLENELEKTYTCGSSAQAQAQPTKTYNEEFERQKLRSQNFLKIAIEVPEEFLNRKLTKRDKDDLIVAIGYPKGWMTLKKALILQDYIIEDVKKQYERYTIISKL